MTVTILIATNHAGPQLIQTIRSIRQSRGMSDVPIQILADTLPISHTVSQSLRRLNASITWLPTQTSQAHKLHQLLKHCRSSHVIMTQDDVLFDPHTLQSVMSVFETAPTTTFVGVKNTPLPARSFLERTISMGTIISNATAQSYRDGDNYLACMGRVMAFPTRWVKNIPIPPTAIALDAYLYFQNKANGGRYRCLFESPVFFRNTSTIEEHVAKGERFRHCRREMHELGVPVGDEEFHLPPSALARGLLIAMATDILATIAYGILMIFVRITARNNTSTITSAWRADMSTKDLGV